MARRRTAKTHPDWMAYNRAMAARRSVLHVIVKTIEKDEETGEDLIFIQTGSSFVIKVDLQAQQSFLLTSAHVVDGQLNPGDGVRVRMMLPVGVEEFPASIVYMSRAHDVAILRVPGLTAAAPLRFSPEDAADGEGIAAVGYCDPDDLFADSGYCKIPAINPGRVRGTVMHYRYKRIMLYHVLLSCVGMEGMLGGPILSKRGVVGMTDSGFVGCTNSVHPRTILGVLKRCVGLQQQNIMPIEDVIELLA